MLLVWQSDISLPPSRKYNDFLLTDSIRILHLFKKTPVGYLALRQLHKSHQNEAALGNSRDPSKRKTDSDN